MLVSQPTPIHDYRKLVVSALSAAEWSGDEPRASILRNELARVDRAIEAGELWEVPF